MEYLFYIFPVIACLAIHLWPGTPLPLSGDMLPFALKVDGAICCCGWLAIGLVHWLVYRSRTTCDEYLGGYANGLYFEDSWVEEIHYTTTYTDRDGNTHTEHHVRHVYHPAQYRVSYTVGRGTYVSESSFWALARQWQASKVPDEWFGINIVGGVRFGCHYLYDEVIRADAEAGFPRMLPITVTHAYTNKVRNSNSIFRFENISRQEAQSLDLYGYPVGNGWTVPAVLSHDITVDGAAARELDVFNAYWAPMNQMRLFVLLFDASRSDVTVAEKQRALWHGGNKNELVVCLGIDGDKVRWSHAWSWADEPKLEAMIESWFAENTAYDLLVFARWLKGNYRVWQRKSFADFDYIRVGLTTTQSITLLFWSLVASGGAAYCALRFLELV